MLTVLLVAGLTLVAFLAVVTVTLVTLLARQAGPVRPLSTVAVVALGAASGEPLGLAAAVVTAGWLQWDGHRCRRQRAERAAARRRARAERLGRPWALPVRRALAAGRRYDGVVAGLRDGPLRHRLAGLAAEVERAVAEVRRTALAGQRAADAAAQVAAAAREGARRGDADPVLSEVLAAQRASAARLEAVADDQRRRLDVVCARLDVLVAEAAELATLATPPGWPASPAVGDGPWPGEQVAALRTALAEVTAAPSPTKVT